MKYDCSVFIGRFQPFHNGHKHVIDEGLKISRQMIIFCGSANKARSIKNPWIYKERKEYISKSFTKTTLKRLHILPLSDHPDDMIWVKGIEEKVKEMVPKANSVAIIGYQKDETSYYLKLFSKWHVVEVSNINDISATHIRQEIFNEKTKKEIVNEIQHLVPKGVLSFLLNFLESNTYLKLKKHIVKSS